ncbi:hypothetical protein GWN42_31315 [candidate division KSB1 bacterium]|nr:hypothetical protein [Phycisphaerae bacterium]NIQ92549.1 hypothetical protein [Deltaproteobacteria bacterium]NIV97159.1 hypothetical protein [candidate division KSB1 bacterium]
MIIGDGTQHSKISIENDFTRDAFGKLRVSNPYPGFSSKAEYSKNNHVWWEVDETGAQVDIATQSGTSSTIEMPIAAVAGSSLIRQTRSWFPYQPGNSHRPIITFAMRAPAPGIVKRVGLFSRENGIFFEQGADGIYYIVLRSSSSGIIVERKIAQSEWNIDTFSTNGLNPSRVNEEFERKEDGTLFSFENTVILDIDLEWLGVGLVRVGFNIDGETFYAHEFRNSGFETTTYMKTASLPIRYEITNVTGENTGSLLQICQGLHIEGGSELWGVPQVASTIITPVSALANAYKGVIAVRPRSLFYTYENRATIIPTNFEMRVISNGLCYVELLHNASITATGWAPIDASADTESATEFTTNITAYSGGHVHKRFYIAADNKGSLLQGSEFIQNLYLNRGYDHTVDADAETYMVVIYPLGNAADVYANLEVAEVY